MSNYQDNYTGQNSQPVPPVIFDQYGQALQFNGYDRWGQPVYVPVAQGQPVQYGPPTNASFSAGQPVQKLKTPKGSPTLGIISLALIVASFVFNGLFSVFANASDADDLTNIGFLSGIVSLLISVASIVVAIIAIKRNQGRVYGIISLSLSAASVVFGILAIVLLIGAVVLIGSGVS